MHLKKYKKSTKLKIIIIIINKIEIGEGKSLLTEYIPPYIIKIYFINNQII